MPKRKKPEEKPEEQFERFLETARDLDVDQEIADRAFQKIVRQPNPQGASDPSKARRK